MHAAAQCYHLVREALQAAARAQAQLAGPGHNEFDRRAVNDALGHLERALAELAWFASPKGNETSKGWRA
jgi:hypothetical protein